MRLLVFLPVLSALLVPSLAEAVPQQQQQQSAPWGGKTEGRVEQFRNMWKEREASRQPGKMDKLVGSADEREHGKFTNPKPYSQMGSGNSAPPPPPPPPSSPPAQPKKNAPQQKKNAPSPPPQQQQKGAPTNGRKKGSRNFKRQTEGMCNLASLLGSGKFPNPEDFFKFAEEHLGTKYSPEELEASRDYLVAQLTAAAKREQERKSNDPPPVQYDDEFLAFASIPKESVAPPAPNVLEVEAKKLGLGDGLASLKAPKGATAHRKAPQGLVFEPEFGIGGAYYSLGYPVEYAGATGLIGSPNTFDAVEVDVSVNRDKEFFAVFEDIKRLCFFFDAKDSQDVATTTPSSQPVDIRFDTTPAANAANAANIAGENLLVVEDTRALRSPFLTQNAVEDPAALSLADARSRKEFDAKAAEIGPYGKVADEDMLAFLTLLV